MNEPCYKDWEKYSCCVECAMCEKEECKWCQGGREEAIKNNGSYGSKKRLDILQNSNE